MDGIFRIVLIGFASIALVVAQFQLGSVVSLVGAILIITVFRGAGAMAYGLAIWCGVIEGVLGGAMISVLLTYYAVVGASSVICERFLVARSLPALLLLGLVMTLISVVIAYGARVGVLPEGGWLWPMLGWPSLVSVGWLLLVNLAVLALWYGLWYHPRHGVRAFVVGG